MRSRGRPTIYDVARHAGVSGNTVARVVRNSGRVSERTAARIQRSIQILGFVPSPLARALATRATGRLGVLLDSSPRVRPDGILNSVQRSARAHGLTTTLTLIGDDPDGSLSTAVKAALSEGISGLIVLASRMSTMQQLEQCAAIVPTLTISSDRRAATPTVGVDRRAGGAQAVHHLASSGHRCIAYIGGPPDWIDARESYEGWREALNELGLAPGPVARGGWSPEFGYQATHRMDLRRASAVFAGSDDIAVGVLHALRERRLRVPDDVAVVGYGDIPEARHLQPPLTTIRHDEEAVGERALSAYLNLVDGVVDEADPFLAPVLVSRESTSGVVLREPRVVEEGG
nr:LacI family DNA-binding transcriptional regulator [Microbacterium testaceum]